MCCRRYSSVAFVVLRSPCTVHTTASLTRGRTIRRPRSTSPTCPAKGVKANIPGNRCSIPAGGAKRGHTKYTHKTRRTTFLHRGSTSFNLYLANDKPSPSHNRLYSSQHKMVYSRVGAWSLPGPTRPSFRGRAWGRAGGGYNQTRVYDAAVLTVQHRACTPP